MKVLYFLFVAGSILTLFRAESTDEKYRDKKHDSLLVSDANADLENNNKSVAKKDKNLTWIIVICILIPIFVIATSIAIFCAFKQFRQPQKQKTTKKQTTTKSSNKTTKSGSSVPERRAETQPTTPTSNEPTKVIIIKTDDVQPLESSSNVGPSKDVIKPKKVSTQQEKVKQNVQIAIKSIRFNDGPVEKSQPYDLVSKFVEDAPRNLNRHKMLTYRGVMPCEIGSRLHPFLQLIFKDYNTCPPRHIASFEIDFFLSNVSDAFKLADGLMKMARQELCYNGAVYEHKQWKSFNAKTKKYISRITTPGFIAWYAFAGEHGGEINFGKNAASSESILNQMSVPALLAIFFRLELDDSIRRSAYTRVRRRLPQIKHLYPEMQLRGMAYPICLIPDLAKKNHRMFADFDNAHGTGTPFEKKPHENYDDDFDKAVEKALPIDETQVSHSDGRKNVVTDSGDTDVGTRTATVTMGTVEIL